jgi:anti-sigma regulatory factor (Ser/Thr protein kinase)
VTLFSIDQIGEVGRHYEILRFQAQPSEVRTCRHAVIGKLRAWETPVRLDDVVLLVSEIVTNAILYGAPDDGAGAQVHVELEETSKGLLVRVRNNGSEWKPKAADPADFDESGRGLMLVDSLSDDWGHHREKGSTSVHFLVRYLDLDSGESPTTEELRNTESGALADNPHEMSRPCDMPTIPARRRSLHDARSIGRTRSSLATSTPAMGSVPAARRSPVRSRSPALRFGVSTRANWLNSMLRLPTPLYFRALLRRCPVQARGTDVRAVFGFSTAPGLVTPASARALVICAPSSDRLPRALYWGGRQHGVPGERIPGSISSRDQQNHRTRTKLTGSHQ